MIALDLVPVVQDFNVGPITVTRRGTATPNEFGEYSASTSSVVMNPIAAYQTTPDEMELEPEGGRRREDFTTFVSAQAFQAGDTIPFRSRTWRVLHLVDHGLQGGVYKVIGEAVE